MHEYCRVIYQSFGCIDMLSLCIYESFELLIVNVGYEYECPVNLSLIRMFTFSVVFVCELVSMPTVGYVTCGCQRHTFFPRRIAPALLG